MIWRLFDSIMKISKAIEELERMKAAYGDVDVEVPRRSKRFHISHYWRGDSEDMEYEDFLTQEEAFEWLRNDIEQTRERFKNEETKNGHGVTVVDFEKLKRELLETGESRQFYCQCPAWYDNFSYWEDAEDVD